MVPNPTGRYIAPPVGDVSQTHIVSLLSLAVSPFTGIRITAEVSLPLIVTVPDPAVKSEPTVADPGPVM